MAQPLNYSRKVAQTAQGRKRVKKQGMGMGSRVIVVIANKVAHLRDDESEGRASSLARRRHAACQTQRRKKSKQGVNCQDRIFPERLLIDKPYFSGNVTLVKKRASSPQP